MSEPRVRRLRVWIVVVAALAVAAALGHRWLELGWQAWDYPVAAAPARTQVVVADGRAFVAAGADGIEVVDLATAQGVALVPPPAPADRIDDLAVADGWLFALDATPPGHLLTFRSAHLGAASSPAAIVAVPVGPFSGVSAAAGVVVVSGGTSQLTLREYGADGRFGAEVASADYGRGQPDVALRGDGRLAAISSHIVGPDFALTFVELRRRPLGLRVLGQVPLRDAGFTAGGFKPAHFPLAAAWRGERVYVADGGGLAVVDVADPAHPRLLRRDAGPRPAIDLAIGATSSTSCVRAGSRRWCATGSTPRACRCGQACGRFPPATAPRRSHDMEPSSSPPGTSAAG